MLAGIRDDDVDFAYATHSRPSLKEKFAAGLEGLLPDDLIGAADIMRFIQGWQNAQVASSSNPPPAAGSTGAVAPSQMEFD
jgi:hypothetical protein